MGGGVKKRWAPVDPVPSFSPENRQPKPWFNPEAASRSRKPFLQGIPNCSGKAHGQLTSAAPATSLRIDELKVAECCLQPVTSVPYLGRRLCKCSWLVWGENEYSWSQQLPAKSSLHLATPTAAPCSTDTLLFARWLPWPWRRKRCEKNPHKLDL